MIVIRAHGNWLARLALSVVCINSGLETIVLGDEVCWSCCAKLMLDKETSEEKTVLVDDTRQQVTMIHHVGGTNSDSDSHSDREKPKPVPVIIEARAEKDSDDEESEHNHNDDGVGANESVTKEEHNSKSKRAALITRMGTLFLNPRGYWDASLLRYRSWW